MVEACESLSDLIASLFATKKVVSGLQARRAKDLTMQIKRKFQALQLNYAGLSGKYEESKRVNKEILEMRNEQDTFFKKIPR